MNYSVSTKRSTDISALYIVTVPVLCPNFSMTAFFLVTKKGDSNILKFVMYRKIYIVNFDVPRSCRKRLHF